MLQPTKFFLCLTIINLASARQYSTALRPLQTALHKKGANIVDTPIHQQHTLRESVEPLPVLPCDLLNFHNNIGQDWRLITAESDARPVIPPLNVNPNCVCYHYRNIKWARDEWTNYKIFGHSTSKFFQVR